jgi:hypothetical protein
VKPVRGSREAAFVGDGDERSEMAKLHYGPG